LVFVVVAVLHRRLRSGLNEVQPKLNDFASRWLITSGERHPFLSGRIE
jgi:hypothetical protein